MRAPISSLLSKVWQGGGRRPAQEVLACSLSLISFHTTSSGLHWLTPPPSFWLVCLQLEEERHQHRPNQLRRLASYVFSSSTLETEQYPHAGGGFIHRSRSAESSPAHAAAARRRHASALQSQGSPRSRHSVLNVSRTQLQQMLAKLMNKNSWEEAHTHTHTRLCVCRVSLIFRV